MEKPKVEAKAKPEEKLQLTREELDQAIKLDHSSFFLGQLVVLTPRKHAVLQGITALLGD